MPFRLIALAAFLVLTRGASAQLVAARDASPVGTWRGTSRCLVRPSACKDEAIVYRIALKGARDSLAIDGRKVIAGREDEMGVLPCELNAARAFITCAIPTGKWRFAVRHDSLVGQLRLKDGTVFRDVRATRSRE
jgi:hypothetical protein